MDPVHQNTCRRLSPRRARRPAALLITLLLAACTTPPATPSLPELAGSSWRLLEFRPAGGGTTMQPAAPDQYVLDFGVDGRLAARLDCNRGTGAFSVAPAAGAPRVTIGPMASTRMMCPPSALGARLPRDIEGERGYRIEGGLLHLEAAGHAGVYVWERNASR